MFGCDNYRFCFKSGWRNIYDLFMGVREDSNCIDEGSSDRLRPEGVRKCSCSLCLSYVLSAALFRFSMENSRVSDCLIFSWGR